MQGYPEIDELMRPVHAAIKRHVKDQTAITEIYNRAYEAIIKSMDVKPALDNTLATIRETIRGYSGDPNALAGLVAEIAELCGVELPDRRDPFINPRTGEVEG